MALPAVGMWVLWEAAVLVRQQAGEVLRGGFELAERTQAAEVMGGDWWSILGILQHPACALAWLARVCSLSWPGGVLFEQAGGEESRAGERKAGGRKWPESKGKSSPETVQSCSAMVSGNYEKREAETNEPQ